MTGDAPSCAPSPGVARRRSRRGAVLAPFEQVVDEHGPTVMRVCRAILERVDAEDAWIDTFVSAMRAYPDLPPGSNVRGWLVTIAHNRAIDQLRAARRRPIPTDTLPEGPSAAAQHVDAADGHDALRAALDALAPKQRAAVVYRHLGDLPYPEIAHVMGISEGAARRNVADGIAKLRTELRGNQP
jgi:RNA polymerase sigma factor (sigma-70 family)